MNSFSIHNVVIALDYNDPSIPLTKTTIPLGPGNDFGPDYPAGSYVEINPHELSIVYHRDKPIDFSSIVAFNDLTTYFPSGGTLNVPPDFQRQRLAAQENHQKYRKSNAELSDYKFIAQTGNPVDLLNSLTMITSTSNTYPHGMHEIIITLNRSPYGKLDLLPDSTFVSTIGNKSTINLSTVVPNSAGIKLELNYDLIDPNDPLLRTRGNVVEIAVGGDKKLPRGVTIIPSAQYSAKLSAMESKYKPIKDFATNIAATGRSPHMSEVIPLIVAYPELKQEVISDISQGLEYLEIRRNYLIGKGELYVPVDSYVNNVMNP